MKKQLRNILLVDDSDEDNEFHEIVIHDGAFAEKITIFTTAEKALAYFESKPNPLPELVFLDGMMPRISGFELVGQIRNLLAEREPANWPKIFLLSGSYNPEMDKILNNPDYRNLVLGYRIKPLTRNMLIEILATHF